MQKLKVVEIEKQEAGTRRGGPEKGSEVWMAVDLSRSKWVYCVRWGSGGCQRWSTPAGLNHVRAAIERYREQRLHVVFEACGFGYELAWWLREQGVEVTVVAPSRIERAPGMAVKTDRVDAEKLACKLEQGQLKGIYIPTRSVHQQRQLGRTYAQCVKERSRARVRIRSLLQEQGLLGPAPTEGWGAYQKWLSLQELAAPIRRCVETLERMRTTADEEARALRGQLAEVGQNEAYEVLVKALCQQAGVGPLSAIRFILELGDIRRFRNSDSLPYYLGLTPSQYGSGEIDHRGHILKCGPGFLRAMLVQCAWAAVRGRNAKDLSQRFERLAPRTGRKRAIIAVARRLAIKLRRRWLEALEPPAHYA
jgi:transposase